MGPKFKGNSEDWLDDEEGSAGGRKRIRPKKEASARATSLPAEQANATVLEVFPNQCRVRLDQDQAQLLCSYRRAQVVGKAKRDIRERTPVAVGDRVLVTRSDTQDGVIEGISVRKNSISRPAPGQVEGDIYHVIAANIDLLVIVASTQDPVFSTGIVDRFLISAEFEKVPAILCITKVDLLSSNELQKKWELYSDLGYLVLELSVKQGLGIDELKEKIKGKTVVFCGHSGVGKTSLLRVLLGVDVGRVGMVSEATGKGRHTTTSALILEGPEGSSWIDTPGVREFGLVGVEPQTLAQCFPEFRDINCEQLDCLHSGEEGCRATDLPRYSSYKRILKSLLAGEH